MKNTKSPPERGKRLLPILRKRVNKHLKQPHIKKNEWLEKTELYSKAVIMFSVWLAPFILLFVYQFSTFQEIALGVISGIGMAGVGMNVMHDASHGAFSKKPWVNKLMSWSMYLLAGNVYNWKKQHVEIHHTHTNIDGMDDDIDTKGLFRFSKKQKWRPHHRLQWLYAVPAYCCMTLLWVFAKDRNQMKRYFRHDKSIPKKEQSKQLWILRITKAMYISLWLVLPLLLWENWLSVIIFFLSMHFTCGLILTVVFQLAHVVPKAQMYDDDHLIEDQLKHQLLTSVNFGTQSRLLNWYLGGLNLQKEHHVFPNKNHIQYRKIKSVVADFCDEIKIEYTEYRTMFAAIVAHFKLLIQLGNKKFV